MTRWWRRIFFRGWEIWGHLLPDSFGKHPRDFFHLFWRRFLRLSFPIWARSASPGWFSELHSQFSWFCAGRERMAVLWPRRRESDFGWSEKKRSVLLKEHLWREQAGTRHSGADMCAQERKRSVVGVSWFLLFGKCQPPSHWERASGHGYW